MANIDRFDADKYMDSDDLPELSLAGKMVWHITRGATVDQASRACGISIKFGQEIVARPLTQAAIRRVRSKAVKLFGPLVITAKDELEWAERSPGEALQ